MITIRPIETALPAGLAPPDLVWTGVVADFSETAEGGLAAADAVRTAVLMLLFTDAACDERELRFEHGGDRRGWVGDGFGIDRTRGEQALGSKLWLLRRSILNATVVRQAEAEARRALQPLLWQKIAARIDVAGAIGGAGDRLDLAVSLYRKDGRLIYADRFDLIWRT